MVAELALSTVNELRLRRAGDPVPQGASRVLFRSAEASVLAGLLLTAGGRRRRRRRVAQNLASLLYLAAGLVFRVAWIQAGQASALDDESVALTARTRITGNGRPGPAATTRLISDARPPRPGRATETALRAWSRAVGRASLLVDRLAARRGHPRFLF
jgi:hypothetical protein